MKRHDTFVVHKGRSYSRRFDSVPVQRAFAIPGYAHQISNPDPKEKMMQYAVEWQMEIVDMQGHNIKTSLNFDLRKSENTQSGQDSAPKKLNAYVADW